MYQGDIRLGDTLYFHFTTRKFSTGSPYTLASSPVISAYPQDSTTQLTAGITLVVDLDSVTGLNSVKVVATSGNGYATATNYSLVITTGTVDSVSVVGEVIGSFSIEARSAVMPTVAARTLDVSATGAAGIDFGNVENPTTVVGLSGTTIKAVTDPVTLTSAYDPAKTASQFDPLTDGVFIDTGGIASGSFAANAIDSAALATSAGQELADRFLLRSIATGTDAGDRTVQNALRPNRNRNVIDVAGNVTVYEEDDVTPAWTGLATRNAAADPITEILPT
jgi:hypothetical protein